jgi:hypothetical protein
VAEAVRYYFDEHIDPAVARGLRRRAIDVLTTQDAGHLGWDDPEQLNFATREGRVIVTFDVDYIIHHNAGIHHAGIAWAPETKYSIGQLISCLTLLHTVYTADDILNNLEYL